MTSPSTFNSTTEAAVRTLSDDDLLKRVGEVAYAQQMSAFEGLELDETTRAEARALEQEIQRRGLQRQ